MCIFKGRSIVIIRLKNLVWLDQFIFFLWVYLNVKVILIKKLLYNMELKLKELSLRDNDKQY